MSNNGVYHATFSSRPPRTVNQIYNGTAVRQRANFGPPTPASGYFAVPVLFGVAM